MPLSLEVRHRINSVHLQELNRHTNELLPVDIQTRFTDVIFRKTHTCTIVHARRLTNRTTQRKRARETDAPTEIHVKVKDLNVHSFMDNIDTCGDLTVGRQESCIVHLPVAWNEDPNAISSLLPTASELSHQTTPARTLLVL